MEIEAQRRHEYYDLVLKSGSSASDLENSSEFLISGPMSLEQGFDLIGKDNGRCELGLLSVGSPARQSALPVTVCRSNAAMKVQKVYRSYRTRRILADTAVVAEELWGQALDFVRLNRCTVSFFSFSRSETAASRWNRVGWNASKVGKGLSIESKAQKLAFQHWIEAIDARHRYGHNLQYYFDKWCNTIAGQPFFYWLDIGDGKEIDLQDCPRSKLRQQCVKYLGPREREDYEFVVVDGKILHKESGELLDTSEGSLRSKWIFVMSTSKRLYIGEKHKGLFHHSSFLAGGTTLAAGRLTAKDGLITRISAQSGHYRPTAESLDTFLSFLRGNGVKLDAVQMEEFCNNENLKLVEEQISSSSDLDICNLLIGDSEKSETSPVPEAEYKTLSGGLQSPKAADVLPTAAILQRINSKKGVESYQLGHQLSNKWSTGAGPRIGCVADYPVELRLQAFGLANVSPRTSHSSSFSKRTADLASA